MGYRYDYWLTALEYTIRTGTGHSGTNSKVVLQVLSKVGDDWEVVSERSTEPGDTDRLDAGTTKTFYRTFAEPIGLAPGNDPLGYRSLVRFRFKIYGHDQWSPSAIDLVPTFLRRDIFGVVGPGEEEPFQEPWHYKPTNWILSTDPAEGGASDDHDGNPATLTLLGV